MVGPRRWTRPLAVAWAIAAIHCAAPEEPATTRPVAERTTVDGVEIVTSLGPRFAEPLFAFREDLPLAQDPADDSLLYNPEDFDQGDDGNYYVADSGNHRVAVFDADGAYLRSFGRAGEGPGELSDALEFAAPVRDDVQVFDRTARRTTRFGLDGELLGSLELPGESRVQGIARLDDGSLAVSRLATAREDDVLSWSGILDLRPSDAEAPRARIATTSMPTMMMTEMQLSAGGQDVMAQVAWQIAFAGMPATLLTPDWMIGVEGDVGELRWYGHDGVLRRRSAVDRPAVAVTASMREQVDAAWQEEHEFDLGGRRVAAAVPEFEYPEVAGRWSRALVDDAGYVWLADAVQRSLRDDADPYRYEVFRPDGEFLGAVDVPVGTFRIRQGRLFGIDEDPLTGEARLRVFVIEPVPDGFEYGSAGTAAR